jgi:hypothetical protein
MGAACGDRRQRATRAKVRGGRNGRARLALTPWRDHIGRMDALDQKTTSPKPEAKQPEGKKVLRARPVKGEVDQNELTDEIIARFPKILAALAK